MRYYLISIIVIVLDQLTKIHVMKTPALQNVELIPHFFYLTYAKNTGMAWSLLSGRTGFLSLVAAAAILAMIWYLEKGKVQKLSRIALTLMIGGAFGNLLDRLLLGYVRDFLDFYIFGYDFPIFNVADMALCIGVGLLILAGIVEKEDTDGKTAVDL